MSKMRNKRSFFHKKITKSLKEKGIEQISYKDVELLKLFITEKGKIIPSRISELSAKSQRHIAKAVKRARNCALLHFSNSKYDLFWGEEKKTILEVEEF
jgi:small subunit ribosomal protein S18